MSTYTGNRKWKGEVGLCCLAGSFCCWPCSASRSIPAVQLFRLSLSVSCGALPRFPGCGPLGGEFPHRRYRAAGAADPPGGRAAGLCRGGGAPPCQGTSGERRPSGGRGPGPGGRGQRRDAVPGPPEPDQPGGGLPPRPPGDPGHPLRRPGRGEEISEAECMRRELVKRGIPESQLHLEEESTSTAGELHVFPPACCRSWGWTPRRPPSPSSPAISTVSGRTSSPAGGLAVFDIPAGRTGSS